LFSTGQKTPHISRNPKSYYYIYNIPPLVPLLIQITPAHALSSYFFKFTPVLSFHQRLGFPDGLLNQVRISLLSCVLRALPISPSWIW